MSPDLAALLRGGAARLGLALPEESVAPLLRHVELLLKWNRTINLTAITDPAEVVEKHVLDSLALAPLLPAGRLLDAGTGGGFPGVPVRLVRADVEVTLVDSVGKKVAFLKNLLADLRLSGATARALRMGGAPAAEGLTGFDAAVCRAFSTPEQWLPLAAHYLRPGGRAFCMAGPRDVFPDRLAGLQRVSLVDYELPVSRAQRRIAAYQLEPGSA